MSEPICIADYDDLIREVLDSGGQFRLYPRGTSMLPLLRQGKDSVSLAKLDRPPRKYDILFYQRADGSYVLHRVKAVTSQGLILWGDNHCFLEYGVQNHQIIGYAARIFREETEISCRSLPYRVYLWLWQFTAVRKVLLFLLHH